MVAISPHAGGRADARVYMSGSSFDAGVPAGLRSFGACWPRHTLGVRYFIFTGPTNTTDGYLFNFQWWQWTGGVVGGDSPMPLAISVFLQSSLPTAPYVVVLVKRMLVALWRKSVSHAFPCTSLLSARRGARFVGGAFFESVVCDACDLRFAVRVCGAVVDAGFLAVGYEPHMQQRTGIQSHAQL